MYGEFVYLLLPYLHKADTQANSHVRQHFAVVGEDEEKFTELAVLRPSFLSQERFVRGMRFLKCHVRFAYLEDIIEQFHDAKVLVFVNGRERANQIGEYLYRNYRYISHLPILLHSSPPNTTIHLFCSPFCTFSSLMNEIPSLRCPSQREGSKATSNSS